MAKDYQIYLPGGIGQFTHLKKNVPFKQKDVLICGSNSEQIAKMFLGLGVKSVSIIVDDYNSLLQSRLVLKDDSQIQVKFMEYTSTDFNDEKFDIVYAQASVSTPERNKIIKELKRITKVNGIISIGEITSLQENPPQFVVNIWESGGIQPIFAEKLAEYYQNKKVKIVNCFDLSKTLKMFYTDSKKMLEQNIDSLSENEKSYYKKILKRMSHESNAYLKLGASDHMGFASLILKK